MYIYMIYVLSITDHRQPKTSTTITKTLSRSVRELPKKDLPHSPSCSPGCLPRPLPARLQGPRPPSGSQHLAGSEASSESSHG